MVFDYTNYLDIWNILVYEIIGDTTLAMILGIITISYLSAKFTIPFQVVIPIMVVFLFIFSVLTSNLSISTLLILASGTFFYWVLSRVFRRG